MVMPPAFRVVRSRISRFATARSARSTSSRDCAHADSSAARTASSADELVAATGLDARPHRLGRGCVAHCAITASVVASPPREVASMPASAARATARSRSDPSADLDRLCVCAPAGRAPLRRRRALHAAFGARATGPAAARALMDRFRRPGQALMRPREHATRWMLVSRPARRMRLRGVRRARRR